MSATHLHLVLNHAPVVGLAVAATLLAWGLVKASQDVKRAALGLLVLASLSAIPVYLTGEPSVQAVKGLPAVSDRYLSQHEEISQIALALTVAVGVAAAATLGMARGGRRLAFGTTLLVLVLSLAAFVLMVWTASLGGKIRHSEIRPIPAATP